MRGKNIINMFCKNCNYEIKTGSRFCQNCGEPVENLRKSEVNKSKTEGQKIKEITILLKTYYGEIMLVLGVGIFSYNVFHFNRKEEYYSGDIFVFDTFVFNGSNAAYSSETLVIILIALGAMLIASGILIIRNKFK